MRRSTPDFSASVPTLNFVTHDNAEPAGRVVLEASRSADAIEPQADECPPHCSGQMAGAGEDGSGPAWEYASDGRVRRQRPPSIKVDSVNTLCVEQSPLAEKCSLDAALAAQVRQAGALMEALPGAVQDERDGCHAPCLPRMRERLDVRREQADQVEGLGSRL